MTRQRVAILPLTQSTEGNRVDRGGIMQLMTRPQRPIRICGVMLEQQREASQLERELELAGIDALATARDLDMSDPRRTELTEAARRLHNEAFQNRGWTQPDDLSVVGFYVGVYSVLISSGPLSANLLVQLGRDDKFQIVTEPVVVGQDVRLNLHNTADTARNVRGALLCEVIQ